MHATEFLAKHRELPQVPVLVLYGPERHLKTQVLHLIPGLRSDSDDEDVSLTRLAGKDADLRSVCDELLTVSMFGGQRIVMIDDADDFVKDNRSGLEKYLERPSQASLLILDVGTWQKTTKLFKAVEKIGLNLDCGELKGAALVKWLTDAANDQYGKKMDRETAALIVQLAGDSLGLLQQELDKVASLVGDAAVITSDDVTRVVGGWRVETTWTMLDALRDGDLAKALDCLHRLFQAGEAPQRILGGMAFSFRRLAEATEIARTTRNLPEALKAAKVFPKDLGASERYLKRLGYDRASRMFQMLLEADVNMKGGSRIDPQLQMEALFVELAGPASTASRN
ncbi:MAG: DNA polymerase III subunit delta [Planctomycetaceae bacterium]|nr:DNA polymerase III subunit delta [Planctomycetaceae bacterium]